MRVTIFSLLFMAVGVPAFADSVSSVTCDSHMQFGFFSGNESGTFNYVASPLKVSVTVPGKGAVAIDDSTHICTVPVSATDVQFSVAGDDAAPVDLYFASRNSSNGEDGGNLAVYDGNNGKFLCANLPGLNNAGILLSNCTIR